MGPSIGAGLTITFFRHLSHPLVKQTHTIIDCFGMSRVDVAVGHTVDRD
jgi:hypothetical protein